MPPLASAEVFDPHTGSWHPVADLGDAARRPRRRTVRDPAGSSWRAAGCAAARTRRPRRSSTRRPASFAAGPDLPAAADGLEAVSLDDGRVLVTGGQSAPGVASDQAVLIAADGTTLEAVGPLATARFKHTMVALDDGRVPRDRRHARRRRAPHLDRDLRPRHRHLRAGSRSHPRPLQGDGRGGAARRTAGFSWAEAGKGSRSSILKPASARRRPSHPASPRSAP